MELNLQRPIVFFDIESTGLDIAKDRIVEICMLKIQPNGDEESLTYRVNPTIPIKKEASEVHGIYMEDIANEPTFKELANDIASFFNNSDIAGYNSNRFDIPLLIEEFYRAKVDFDISERKLVDVQTIFHKMEARTLSAAYRFYCDKSLENAHSAEADTYATYEILKSQLNKYQDAEVKAKNGNIEKPIKNDISALSSFSCQKKSADLAGFIGYNDKDEEIINFGKHKGLTVVELLETTPAYISWVLNADFPSYTKQILKNIKNKYDLKKKFGS